LALIDFSSDGVVGIAFCSQRILEIEHFKGSCSLRSQIKSKDIHTQDMQITIWKHEKARQYDSSKSSQLSIIESKDIEMA
jgi:hypothetical protein